MPLPISIQSALIRYIKVAVLRMAEAPSRISCQVEEARRKSKHTDSSPYASRKRLSMTNKLSGSNKAEGYHPQAVALLCFTEAIEVSPGTSSAFNPEIPKSVRPSPPQLRVKQHGRASIHLRRDSHSATTIIPCQP